MRQLLVVSLISGVDVDEDVSSSSSGRGSSLRLVGGRVPVHGLLEVNPLSKPPPPKTASNRAASPSPVELLSLSSPPYK